MVGRMMVEGQTGLQISITEALGVRGWSHLDAVILAALATELPLLLVGPHGTAKSLLVERVATALGLPMRHYNAALLNYDDLVGIPLPDEQGDSLHFVSTPGAIWEAGFVFFDEISRCRADLQNKMFPIIHERRVVGIGLDALRHRWAAMNPPAPEELTGTTVPGEIYLGSEALDPALIDRFPFIVSVPNWSELTKEDKRLLVSWQGVDDELPYIDLNLPELVERCAGLIAALEDEFADWLSDYILYAMDLLEQARLPQSPRRARMLARSIVAVHAARMVLEGDADSTEFDPQDSAEIALIYGMPQTATDVPPSLVKLVALHKQAWETTQYLEDDVWRQVMEELDLARRVTLADQLGLSDSDMSRLVTQTLGAEDSDARQIGLATAMFLAFRERRSLDPSAYEPLAQLAYHVMEPRMLFTTVPVNGTESQLWREIKEWLRSQQYRAESWMHRLERNYILNGFPILWRKHNWREALEQFTRDLILFGIEESSQS